MHLGAIPNKRARNGNICGRLHVFVADVSPGGLWTQRSVKAILTKFKMKLPASRTQVIPCWHRARRSRSNLHKKVAAIALENPTSNIQRASCLATHSDMDKLDKMAVDKWRPKLVADSYFDDP